MEIGPKKDKESKKTDKKRAAEVLSSATFAVDRKGTAEALPPRRASKLDRAIADLAVPRPDAVEKPKKPAVEFPVPVPEIAASDSKSSEAVAVTPQSERVVEVASETKDEDIESDGKNENEPAAKTAPEQREQLSPRAVYAGEVVLNLHDDDSPQEDEIPLNAVSAENDPVTKETDSEDEPDDPVTPVTPPAVTWRAQPQQQHQQQYNRPTPPPVPPVTPPTPPNRPTPPGPNNPNLPPPPPGPNYNTQPPLPPGPPVEVLNPNDPNSLVTRREMEDEVYYAQKAAQNKGVLAGLIVGGGYEHFKHRRREKKQERVMREQDRKLKRSLENNAYLQTESDRLRSQTAELNGETGRRPESVTTAAEKPKAKLEKLRPHGKKRFEQADDKQLEIPPEHHIETSAWHSIEVDNRTGKAVEDPTFNYGREYKREKQKENIQKQHDLQSAAGEVALVAAAIGGLGNGSSDDASGDGGNSKTIPSASTKGMARGDGKKPGKSPGKTDPQAIAQSAIQLLPWAVVLLVIIVVLIIVMR